MHQPIRSQLTRKQRRQLPSLARLFLIELEQSFPAQPFRAAIEPVRYAERAEEQIVVRLAPVHPEVPELWFTLHQPDEVTAYWGEPGHTHIVGDFLWKRKGIPQDEAESLTVAKTIAFVRDVLSDRAVLIIHSGGGVSVYRPASHEALLRLRQQPEPQDKFLV